MLRAITCIVKLPRTKNGNGPTVYVSANRPTPTLESVTAYPPIRASTLATFELVTTLPETRSPGWTVVSLTATSRICGAASAGTRGTFLAIGGGVANGVGDALGAGVVARELVGKGLGLVSGDAGPAPGPIPVACDAGDGFAVCAPRLQLESASNNAAMAAAHLALRIRFSFLGGALHSAGAS